MKLTPEEIQFIDKYLQNAEVLYVDIRFEMIDHIASSVEAKMERESVDFYNAFKDYMIENKASLLKNKGTISFYSKELIEPFLKFMVHPLRLIFVVFLYVVLNFVHITAYFSEDFTIQNLFFVLLLLTAIVQTVYCRLILQRRFFVIERLGGLLVLLYYLQMFFMNNYSTVEPADYTLTILFYLLLVYWFYFAKEMRKFVKYKKHLFQ